MTGYQAIYKCRLCGNIYNGVFTGNEDVAISTSVRACLGIKSQELQSPHLHEVHSCKNGDLGIGDFQGYKNSMRGKRMGYEMRLKVENFYIKKENKGKALELLKELCRTDNDIQWVSNSFVISADTLEKAIKECCWRFETDEDGNVIGINFSAEKSGDESKIFNAIAPMVETGSFIEMIGKDGYIWRWVFKDGKCEEVRPKVEWKE